MNVRSQGKSGYVRLMTKGWKRPFDDPTPLPRGRQLITLEDAAKYIQRLPKAEQQLDEWQAAVEAMLLVVELNSVLDEYLSKELADWGNGRRICREQSLPRPTSWSSSITMAKLCGLPLLALSFNDAIIGREGHWQSRVQRNDLD